MHPSPHMLSIKCHRVRGNLVYSRVPNCRSNTRSNTPLNKENKRQRDASSQRLQTGCHRALPGFKLSSEGWAVDSTTLELQQQGESQIQGCLGLYRKFETNYRGSFYLKVTTTIATIKPTVRSTVKGGD